MFNDYSNYDGLGLAELVNAGEVSSSEVADAVFAAIEHVNPSLNAIVRTMHDDVQRALSNGLPKGPFTGVPMVAKDEYLSFAGTPCDMASRLGRGFTRDYDSELVRRYRSAGLVCVGKSNLPEFGASVTTEPVATGATGNPWDVSRTAGGSSGGSAAAVAAGIVPIGYGNDGAGSIRIPSSCCGVFGLKPTRGRVPTGPDDGEYWNGLVIQHAITRSVRDSAALLDATEAPDPGAPYWPPARQRPFLNEVGAPPGRLRIGFSAASPTGGQVDPECVKAMERTATLCVDLGHDVEEAAPRYDAAAMQDALARLLSVHLAYGIDSLAAAMGRDASTDIIERANYAIAQQGRELPAPAFLDALETFSIVSRQTAPFFETYDLALTPTLARPPVEHGYITADDPDWRRYLKRFFAFIPFTPLANVTGNPAMTVPLHSTAGGLPVGVNFLGRFGDEATLFRLASQLEMAQPWSTRRPPVWAGD